MIVIAVDDNWNWAERVPLLLAQGLTERVASYYSAEDLFTHLPELAATDQELVIVLDEDLGPGAMSGSEAVPSIRQQYPTALIFGGSGGGNQKMIKAGAHAEFSDLTQWQQEYLEDAQGLTPWQSLEKQFRK